MARVVTIYALCDPATGEPRYIGKANNLTQRIRSHKWESRNKRFHTRKINWLRSLTCDPIVKILQVTNSENWQDAERWWISEMRRQYTNLTNFADGGQTSPVEGRGHTEETKNKLRLLAIQRGGYIPSRKGQLVSQETRKKLRTASLRNGNKPPPTGGWNKGILNTHCVNGHEYTPQNTYIAQRHNPKRTHQQCRICMRAASEKWLRKKDYRECG